MSKKSSSVKIYKTEQDVIDALNSIDGPMRGSAYKPNFLRSIPKKLRTSRVCNIVFSNPDKFNLEKEIEFVPQEIMTEDFLMKSVLFWPELLSPDDKTNTKHIPRERLTLPVYVAFELGKRSRERKSRIGYKLDYPEFEMENYKRIICEAADSIEEQEELQIFFNDTNEKNKFYLKLIDLIRRKLNSINCLPNTKYERKYTNFTYSSGKKLLILISGHSDSGKTTLSQCLSCCINNSTWFDSDIFSQVQARVGTDLAVKEFVKPERSVVIYSNLNSFSTIVTERIKEEMGQPNILYVYIKPSSVYQMHAHSKYRGGEDIKYYKKKYLAFDACFSQEDIDLTVINDYLPTSMAKACDEIIEACMIKFGTQEQNHRPTSSDFITRVGTQRVEDGAIAVEDGAIAVEALLTGMEMEEK